MATNVDTTQIILDLLSNNWNSANTDGLTPEFKKIFQVPKTNIDFDYSRDYILCFNPNTENLEVGLGNNTIEDVFETVTIDVRSYGDETLEEDFWNDTHMIKLKTEVNRILKTNKVNFNANFNELRSIQQWQELNDRYRGIFRAIKTVELVDYCREFA